MHRPVRGNVRKFRGEVCDRDRRKDRKEHKIPSLKTKEVKERSLRLEGGIREPQKPGGASQEPGAEELCVCYPPEAAMPSREQLASPAGTGARYPVVHSRGGRRRWCRDRNGAQLCSGQWRLWRFLLPGSWDSHGGVSIGSAPPAGLRVAPARAAVGEGK